MACGNRSTIRWCDRRYVAHTVQSRLEIWTLRYRLRHVTGGKTLRISQAPALVHWSVDGWHTTQNMAPLLHLGMVLVGVPYSVQELCTTQRGGSPYGLGHVAGADNTRDITPEEAVICRALGRRLAMVGQRLRQG